MSTPRLDLIGRSFERLTVLAFAGVKHGTRWLCLCSCGQRKVVDGSKLTRGLTRSCGCLMRENQRALKRDPKHSHCPLGKPSTTYKTWGAIIQRCTNPRCSAYERYGARGITVCERWRDSFVAFLEDMGERPVGKTIDRKDNSKGYEPGNCRWATHAEQGQNTRRTRLTEALVMQARRLCFEDGRSPTQVARALGISPRVLADAVAGKSWKNIATHSEAE